MKYVLFENGTKVPYDDIESINVIHRSNNFECQPNFDSCWAKTNGNCYTKYTLKTDKTEVITITRRKLFKTITNTTYAQPYYTVSGSYKIISE